MPCWPATYFQVSSPENMFPVPPILSKHPPSSPCSNLRDRTEKSKVRQSIFIWNGYVQHAGAGWNGTHFLGYHMYVIHEGSNLRDEIFSCVWSVIQTSGDINSPDISL